MRRIGQVGTKQQAERITAWMLTRDIAIRCEEENGRWEIWVRDEDQIDEAAGELQSFQADPDAPRYRAAVDEANRLVREKKKKELQARSQQVDLTTDRWNAPLHRVAPLTMAMIVVSGIIALLTNFGNDVDGATFRALALTSLTAEQASEIANGAEINPWDVKVRIGSLLGGEVWRAVTPVFIHHGVFHLIFNMYWLVIFGRQIESRYGTGWLLLLVVLVAVPSNIAGMLVPEEMDGIAIAPVGSHWTVLLGGMSGVVYGLFGYTWMKVMFDARSGLLVSSSTAAVLLIWLVMCMMPGFGELFGIRIANWAHGVGLMVGLIIGYWPKLLSDLGIGGDPDAGSK